MKCNNRLDPHLETKLKKALKQTKKINWLTRKKRFASFIRYLANTSKRVDKKTIEKRLRNKAVIRYNWNKFEARELDRLWHKVSKRFIEFLDVATDVDPQFCFVSGRYIAPRYLGVTAIKPYKRGHWCYKYEYDKYLTHEITTEKLKLSSMLICIARKPTEPMAFTHRARVENNALSMIEHIRRNESDFEFRDYDISTWTMQYFKFIRARYFLRPNGRPFPKVDMI